MGRFWAVPIAVATLASSLAGAAPPRLLGGVATAAVHPGRTQAIRRFFDRWSGTPYRWGGTSRSGIDCSAYLRQMYRDLFDVELPRTTRQQIHLGVDLRIDRKELDTGLEPGDLIFFVDRVGVPNHVVVYVGGGRITHSVSGRGVVFESIDRLYGRRVVGRRLLIPASPGQTPISEGGFGALPAAPLVVATEIPCPPRFAPKRRTVRKWSREPLRDFKALGEAELCTVRGLAAALREHRGPHAHANAERLALYADWMERLDATSENLFGDP